MEVLRRVQSDGTSRRSRTTSRGDEWDCDLLAFNEKDTSGLITRLEDIALRLEATALRLDAVLVGSGSKPSVLPDDHTDRTAKCLVNSFQDVRHLEDCL